jgi:hypothetical protein
VPRRTLAGELGRSWLASAKIARKAGQWQTAYSAMLQAQQNKARFTFMESAKLVKVMGEPLRAIQELENSMRSLGLLDDNILDLTGDDEETHQTKAKVHHRFSFYTLSDLGSGASPPCSLDERIGQVRGEFDLQNFPKCNRTTTQVILRGSFPVCY